MQTERGGDEERAIKIPKFTTNRTKAQVEEHRARAHLPYRSWCPDCVDGRTKNPPHHRVHDSDHGMPT
eukprot:975908-Heterocapsa_arctica.AAC.1